MTDSELCFPNLRPLLQGPVPGPSQVIFQGGGLGHRVDPKLRKDIAAHQVVELLLLGGQLVMQHYLMLLLLSQSGLGLQEFGLENRLFLEIAAGTTGSIPAET